MVQDAGHGVQLPRRVGAGRKEELCGFLARYLCVVLLIGAPSISLVVLPQLTMVCSPSPGGLA